MAAALFTPYERPRRAPAANVCKDGADSELHQAARAGDAAAIERLASKGMRLDAVNHVGRTPLAEAVACGHHAAATMLVELGCDPAVRNSALTAAVLARRASMVRFLFQRGCRVVPTETSPVLTAGYEPEVVSELLYGGLAPDVQLSRWGSLVGFLARKRRGHVLTGEMRATLGVLLRHGASWPSGADPGAVPGLKHECYFEPELVRWASGADPSRRERAAVVDATSAACLPASVVALCAEMVCKVGRALE